MFPRKVIMIFMAVAMLCLVVAYGIATFVYVLCQAIVGWRIGAFVECISVGIGPVVLRRQYCGTEWRLSALPFGGYTKFYGHDELDSDESTHDRLETRTRFSDTPIVGRMVLMLVGPLSNVVLGLLLLWIPVAAESQQLTTDNMGTQIVPVSVPSIGLSDKPSTWEGQLRFVDGTAVRFWREIANVFRTQEWGGPVSWMYTTALVAWYDTMAWCSCSGVFIFIIGVVNLLSLPVLNGGHLVFLVFEAIGRPVSKNVIGPAHMFGLLMIIAVFFCHGISGFAMAVLAEPSVL